ncbi:hypothetical protein B0H17DRAFT_1200068 [Mycena rosella]|uniref:Uncharacterized protein n=1 Tax=Mycena rosella TaxID=1033263 RepID=A0AAD7GG26_MYCRO|nr:hypothetical protein B0H17DRAFT_1200068 [Mycena rosella]
MISPPPWFSLYPFHSLPSSSTASRSLPPPLTTSFATVFYPGCDAETCNEDKGAGAFFGASPSLWPLSWLPQTLPPSAPFILVQPLLPPFHRGVAFPVRHPAPPSPLPVYPTTAAAYPRPFALARARDGRQRARPSADAREYPGTVPLADENAMDDPNDFLLRDACSEEHGWRPLLRSGFGASPSLPALSRPPLRCRPGAPGVPLDLTLA